MGQRGKNRRAIQEQRPLDGAYGSLMLDGPARVPVASPISVR
jgi:hypothetical protein